MKSNLIKIISVIILIVIVGAFFALKNSFFTSNTNATTFNVRSSEHNDYEGSKLETMSFKNEKLAFEKATNVTISSPEEVNSFIPTNASFDLNFDDEVSE